VYAGDTWYCIGAGSNLNDIFRGGIEHSRCNMGLFIVEIKYNIYATEKSILYNCGTAGDRSGFESQKALYRREIDGKGQLT
jgi:hypothetical protein